MRWAIALLAAVLGCEQGDVLVRVPQTHAPRACWKMRQYDPIDGHKLDGWTCNAGDRFGNEVDCKTYKGGVCSEDGIASLLVPSHG